MNFFGHVLVGLLVSGLVALVINFAAPYSPLPYAALALTPTLLGVVLLGAILPDADHPQTRIHRLLQLGVLLLAAWLAYNYTHNLVLAILAGFAGVGLFVLLKPRHRGITHTKTAALAYGIIIALLAQNALIGIVGAVAYYSHLLADGMG